MKDLDDSRALSRRTFLKECTVVTAGAAVAILSMPTQAPAKTVPFDSVCWLPSTEELMAMEPDIASASFFDLLQWDSHRKYFGEEIARVNLLLTTEPRKAYVWRMMGEMERKGIPLSHSREREWQDELEREVEKEFAEGKL